MKQSSFRSYLFLILTCLCCSFYSQVEGINEYENIYFNYKNEQFKINIENRFIDELNSRYDYLCPWDNFTIADVDSLIVYSDDSDTLYVFTDKSRFIAFCSKRNDQYYLSELHFFVYNEYIEDIYMDDFNMDSNIDFVFIEHYEAQPYFYIYSYDRLLKKFIFVLREDHLGNFETINFQFMFISQGIIYLAYQNYYSLTKKVNIGIIDFSKDESKEFNFRPLCTISLKKWEKLIKNNQVHQLLEKYEKE